MYTCTHMQKHTDKKEKAFLKKEHRINRSKKTLKKKITILVSLKKPSWMAVRLYTTTGRQ